MPVSTPSRSWASQARFKSLPGGNPHVYVVVETQQSGTPVEWELQMGSLNGLSRRGWTRNTLRPGDQVTVRLNPSVGGRAYGILRSVEKEGGLSLNPAAPAPDVTPPTATLAGRWLTDRQSVLDYPAGSFDTFFREQLSLTEKGRAAQAAFDALSDENPEATCVGRPTPSALVSTGLYLMEIDLSRQETVIVFRSEWFNEVRTIYMDGRGHPDPGERFRHGPLNRSMGGRHVGRRHSKFYRSSLALPDRRALWRAKACRGAIPASPRTAPTSTSSSFWRTRNTWRNRCLIVGS